MIDFTEFSVDSYRDVIWPRRGRLYLNYFGDYAVGHPPPDGVDDVLAVAPTRGMWRMMGIFVGLPRYPDGLHGSAITVTIRAYNGLRQEVASASVTVGPELDPYFVHCLMVAAPEIAYVSFSAQSDRGIVPVFYFDNLFYVAAEAGERACRDFIRITSPADGARLAPTDSVPVTGELLQSLWPVEVSISVNGREQISWRENESRLPHWITRDPADPSRFTFRTYIFGSGRLVIRAQLRAPRACGDIWEGVYHSITVDVAPTPTPTRTPTPTATPTPTTQPNVFAVLRSQFTQHGVFDRAMRSEGREVGFRFPQKLVARKSAALRLTSLIGAGSFGATPAVAYPVELHVTYGDGTRRVYRALHRDGPLFRGDRPFGGVQEMYFFLPGNDIAPGLATFDLVYHWAGSVVHRQLLGRATFSEMPTMRQYYVFFESLNWSLLTDAWDEASSTERIYPVSNIEIYLSPGAVRLPRGSHPSSRSTEYDFTWDFVQDDNRDGRLRLKVDLQRVVDCNRDGRIDTNDPLLKVLVDDDGDGRPDFDPVRIPYGGLLGDWGHPEDSNDNGVISVREMSNFVRSFYDRQTGEWYDYLDFATRWRFSPGDAFVDFREVGPNGDCQPDGDESTWTPATRRRDNLWSYMRAQARQLMLDDAARSGLSGMVTTALLPASMLYDPRVIGNCGRGTVCWATVGTMSAPHEIGHFWGLAHDTPFQFPEGALNTWSWSWVSDAYNLMFPGVFPSPGANFLSASRFDQMFDAGLDTNWRWAAEPRSTGARLVSNRPGLAAQAVSQRALLVAGTVTAADEASLDVSYMLDAAAVSLPQGGAYRVELLDANGNILVAVPFAVSFTEECHDCGLGNEVLRKGQDSFSLVLPYPQEAVRLRVMRHQAVLLERRVTASPPELKIMPIPEEPISRDRPLSLRWEATDPDGDELTFNLAFSQDGGATYKTFAVGLRKPVYEVDPTAFPGGQHLYLQVTASDGFHTVAASWGPLRLPDAAPHVAILHPEEGTVVGAREILVLHAVALDLEDGIPSSHAVVWEDQTGRVLGQGSRLELEGLPPGEYTLTVRVTDSAGQRSEDRVQITVVERPRREPLAPLPLKATIEGLPATSRLPSCGPSALDLTLRFDTSQPRFDSLALLLFPPVEAGEASPLLVEPESAGERVYTARFELTQNSPAGKWHVRAIALDAEGRQWLDPGHTLKFVACKSATGDRWALLVLVVVTLLGTGGAGLLLWTRRGRRAA